MPQRRVRGQLPNGLVSSWVLARVSPQPARAIRCRVIRSSSPAQSASASGNPQDLGEEQRTRSRAWIAPSIASVFPVESRVRGVRCSPSSQHRGMNWAAPPALDPGPRLRRGAGRGQRVAWRAPRKSEVLSPRTARVRTAWGGRLGSHGGRDPGNGRIAPEPPKANTYHPPKFVSPIPITHRTRVLGRAVENRSTRRTEEANPV